jgi:hypothetical protein
VFRAPEAAGAEPAEHGHQLDRQIGIAIAHRRQAPDRHHRDAQFLADLAHHAGFRRLVAADFTAREFPSQTAAHGRGALRDQDPAAFFDDGAGDAHKARHSASLARSRGHQGRKSFRFSLSGR